MGPCCASCKPTRFDYKFDIGGKPCEGYKQLAYNKGMCGNTMIKARDYFDVSQLDDESKKLVQALATFKCSGLF
jgi:hypothetical protein